MRRLHSLALGLLALAAGAVGAGPAAREAWPDQLTVYVIPAPRPIKWDSPRKLLPSSDWPSWRCSAISAWTRSR